MMDDTGSFWATMERETSVTDILGRPDVQLDDVLDFANVIRDVKYQIEPLLRYLSEPNIITQMIDYIIQRRPLQFTSQISPVVNTTTDELYAKRAHTCADIFHNAPLSFLAQVVRQPTHLRHLFSFLDTDDIIDPAYTGAFRKAMLAMVQRRPLALTEFVQNDLEDDEQPESPDGDTTPQLVKRSRSLNALIKHIYLHPALEILIHIGWDTGRPAMGLSGAARDTAWLTEYGFLDHLLDTANGLTETTVAQPSEELNELVQFRRFESQANAARALIDLLAKCPKSTVLNELQKPETVSKLLRLIHPILATHDSQTLSTYQASMQHLVDTTGPATALANSLALVVLMAHHQLQATEENAASLDDSTASKQQFKALNTSSDLLLKFAGGNSNPDLSATLNTSSDELKVKSTSDQVSALLQHIVEVLPFFLGVLAGDDTSVISADTWNDHESSQRCIELYQAGIELAARVTRSNFATPNGRVIAPFGESRVKTLELIGLLLRVRESTVENALISSHALKLVLSLMPRYPSNSLVHALVESCICTVLQAGSKTLLENLVYDAGMLHWLIQSGQLHAADPLNYSKSAPQRQLLLGSSTKSSTETEQPRPAFRMGFLPFLNRIGKIVCSVASTIPELKGLFESVSKQGASTEEAKVAHRAGPAKSEEGDIWEKVRQWEETLKPTASENVYQKMRNRVASVRVDSDEDDYYNELIRQNHGGVEADSAALMLADYDDEDKPVDRATIIRAMGQSAGVNHTEQVSGNHSAGLQRAHTADDDDDDDDVFNTASRDSSDSDDDQIAQDFSRSFDKTDTHENQTSSSRVFVPSSASSVAGAWGLNTDVSGNAGTADENEDDELAASVTLVATTNLSRSASGTLSKHPVVAHPTIATSPLDDDDDDPFAFVSSSTPAAGVQSIIAGSRDDSSSDDTSEDDEDEDEDTGDIPIATDADDDPFSDFANNGLVMAADKIPQTLVRSSSLVRTKSKPDTRTPTSPLAPVASAATLPPTNETKAEVQVVAAAAPAAAVVPSFDDDPFADLAQGSSPFPLPNPTAASNSQSEVLTMSTERQTEQHQPDAAATVDGVETIEVGSDDEDGTSLRAVAALMAKHSDPSAPVVSTGSGSSGVQGFSPIISAAAPEQVRLSATNLDDLADAASSAVNALMTQAAVETTWCGEDPFE